ncbi:MAG: hypothetical protein ACPHO4_00855 [Longimicrobiales bacterium]|jgi:hypothetical protein
MAEHTVTETSSDVPGIPDSENEALIDAEKTFKITVIGAILFGLAALFIIMRTRMG